MFEKITKAIIIFTQTPSGIITIPAGKLGYKRKTSIRLQRDKNTKKICFKVKGNIWYFETEDSKVFKPMQKL